MKTIILFLSLVTIIIACDCKHDHKHIKDVSSKVLEVGKSIVEKGKTPPAPVKAFIEAKLDSLKKK